MKTHSQSLAPLNPKKIKVQTFWASFNKVCSRVLQIVLKMGAQVLWNKSLCVVAWCYTGWFSFRLRLPTCNWKHQLWLCEAPVKHTVTQILLNSWNVKSRDPHKACAQIFELRCNEKLANLLSAQSAAQMGAWSLWLFEVAARFQCCGSSSSFLSSCCCCRFGQNSYESKSIESLMFSTEPRGRARRPHPSIHIPLIPTKPRKIFPIFQRLFWFVSPQTTEIMHLLVFWLILGSIPLRPTEVRKPAAKVRDLGEAGGEVFTKLWCWWQTLKFLRPKIDQVLLQLNSFSITKVERTRWNLMKHELLFEEYFCVRKNEIRPMDVIFAFHNQHGLYSPQSFALQRIHESVRFLFSILSLLWLSLLFRQGYG